MMFEEVIDFWFDEISPKSWWEASPEFDELVRSRFGLILVHAAAGEMEHWRRCATGRLAEVIVLDQFSRNVYRGSAKAFAQDPMALVLAQEAIANGSAHELSPQRRAFLYMPFMHSESKAIHARAELLFKEIGIPESHDFELKHKAIIDRFGRYPHRNAILGRVSSEAELEFLKQPGSSF